MPSHPCIGKKLTRFIPCTQVVLDFQVVVATEDETAVTTVQETVETERLSVAISEAIKVAAASPTSSLSGVAVSQVVVAKPEPVAIVDPTPEPKLEVISDETTSGSDGGKGVGAETPGAPGQVAADETKSARKGGISTQVAGITIGVAAALSVVVLVLIRHRGKRRTHPVIDAEAGNRRQGSRFTDISHSNSVTPVAEE